MKQFMDVFSLPEMTLLAVANDYFISNKIEYDPVHLYKDVSVSTLVVLLSSSLYQLMQRDRTDPLPLTVFTQSGA